MAWSADHGYRTSTHADSLTITFDAATGREVQASETPGRVDSARGDYLAGLFGYSRSPTAWVQLRFIDRSVEPTRQFHGAVRAGTWEPNAPVTLGVDHVYVTGPGLVSAAPGDSTQGNGIRAIPLQGTESDCTVSTETRAACPTHRSRPRRRWCGALVVPAEDGRLQAFAADGCASASCERVWSADAGGR